MMQHVSPAPAVTMMATQSVPPPSYQESQQVKEVHRHLPHGFCCAVFYIFPLASSVIYLFRNVHVSCLTLEIRDKEISAAFLLLRPR